LPVAVAFFVFIGVKKGEVGYATSGQDYGYSAPNSTDASYSYPSISEDILFICGENA
jgi:hypothetical protein